MRSGPRGLRTVTLGALLGSAAALPTCAAHPTYVRYPATGQHVAFLSSQFRVSVNGGCSVTQFAGERRGDFAVRLEGRRAVVTMPMPRSTGTTRH
jgi:hypothetical protein